MFLSPPKSARRRRRGGGPALPSLSILVFVLIVLGALGYGGYLLISSQLNTDERRPTVEKFAQAWAKGDYEAMYAMLDAPSRKANPKISFLAEYRRANKAAGVEKITLGKIGPLLSGGNVRVPVRVKTKDFGTLKGALTFHATQTDEATTVAWSPEQVLPGLRKGEEVRRQRGAAPKRGNIYAAGGKLLNSDDLGASIAGVAGKKPTGLERIYNDRLAGRPTSTLRFGDRAVARVKGRKGRSITTTIRLGLQRTAQNALGGKLGGVAVIKPSDGSVLALAGIAVSAPQPPGSSFKIITAAAALQHGVAKMSSSYPVRTAATLSGVRLRNASDEQCGGSLTSSFAHSCNSVFGPIGAKLGAKKLVAAAVMILKLEPGGWGAETARPASASTEPSLGLITAIPPSWSPSASCAVRVRPRRIVVWIERPLRPATFAIVRSPKRSEELRRPPSRSL